jgi:Protein of unknown function (DUF2569)
MASQLDSSSSKALPRLTAADVKRPTPKGVGGWLGLFVATLILVYPISSLISLAVDAERWRHLLSQYPELQLGHALYLIVSSLQIVISVYAGSVILRLKPRAPRTAKWCIFLMWALSFLKIGCFVGQPVTQDVSSWLLGSFVYEFFGRAIYAIIWGLYLERSDRVAETFPAYVQPRAVAEKKTELTQLHLK